MQIRTTEDGSHTLFSEMVNECYHSEFGAIQESEHIFIKSAFKACKKEEIKLIEIGFGTGLNAFLTLLESEKDKKKLTYTTLELYPIAIELAEKLNFTRQVDNSKEAEFLQLHTSPWNEKVEISPFFTLEKKEIDFTKYRLTDSYDIIYFDAFSPERQAEMWTQECFDKLYAHANDDAILVSYCAKGVVRRSLQTAGFTVERLPGPPGKREILRAKKTAKEMNEKK